MRTSGGSKVRSWVVRGILLVCLAGFLIASSGCNTWKGAGKDVEDVGEKMQGD